jgi:hypothetical protein
MRGLGYALSSDRFPELQHHVGERTLRDDDLRDDTKLRCSQPIGIQA